MRAQRARPAAVGPRGSRRELLLALVLVAAGGATLLLAGGRTWWWATWLSPDFPTVAAVRSGREAAPGAWGCGLLGLAGTVGVLATSRVGRLVTGLVLTLAGAAATAVSAVGWSAEGDPGGWPAAAGVRAAGAADQVGVSGWPAVSVLGGLALLAGGLWVCLRGRRWPRMGSRYDAPGSRGGRRTGGGTGRPGEPVPDGSGLWAALDRGEDPTG